MIKNRIVVSLSTAVLTVVASVACGSTALDLGGKGTDPQVLPPPATTSAHVTTLDWNGNWEWLAPQLTGQTLRAAWAAAPDDIWIVGDGGTVIRWDGHTHAKVAYQGPADASYHAITGSSPNNVWIAGNKGALHFNGTSWSSSVGLGTLSVRTLMSCAPGAYVALTTDGTVWTYTDANPWSRPIFRSNKAPVLDASCADAGGLYTVDATGVDLSRPGSGTPERTVEFVNPLPFKSKVADARILGRDPSTFRFVLAYDQGDESGFLSYMYYPYNLGAAAPAGVSAQLIEAVSKSSLTLGHQIRPLMARADADTLVIRLGEGHKVWMLDQAGLHQSTAADSRITAAYPGVGGQVSVLGDSGYAAALRPSGASGLAIVQQASSDMDPVDFFSVGRDGSAWGVRYHALGDRSYTDSFGLWDETSGWQWHSVPDAYAPSSRIAGTKNDYLGPGIVAVAALSATSMWAILRHDGDADPQYAGGSTLAHWDGARFDQLQHVPTSLRTLAADSDGGLFALATNGELSKVDMHGAFTPLGDAGTANESSFALCKPQLTPIKGGGTWVLDSVCTLSVWDGQKLATMPTFRTAIHGSGYLEFGMWASSATSLWVTDSMRGLLHFDGHAWNVVWTSEMIDDGIWGADESHIWFADRGPLHGDAGRVMRMWDGSAVKAVMSVPNTWTFAGGDDTAWLAGSSLLRLKAAKSVQPTH